MTLLENIILSLMVGKEKKRQREGSIKKVRAVWGPGTAKKSTLYLKLDTWFIRPVLKAVVECSSAHLVKYCTVVHILCV